ncbi:MAG: glycosyltransferase family 2 protein [Luteolibacter sp.]
MSDPELLVVLPVYNERESIRHVIDGWMAVLARSVPEFAILAINDGSTDDSGKILRELQAEYGSRLKVLARGNKGHGQTCLEGYRIAEDRGIPYVLQIDSDGQSDPRFFHDFWVQRNDYDVIYGKRRRLDGWQRIAASLALRTLLRLLEGTDCTDANVPYRLMNTAACRSGFHAIPETIGLANVALAVLLKRDKKLRHGSIPIDFPPRFGGEPSVPMGKFLIKGYELFAQLRHLKHHPAK